MSVTTRDPGGTELAERLIIHNDLTKLSAKERLDFYRAKCRWYGLDWRLAPFDYIMTKQGVKLHLNATGTDLLRAQKKITIVDSKWEIVGQLVVSTVEGQMPDGRRDREIGAVSIANARGDDLANAIMKSMTKAKRRLVISMGGIGTDEDTEAESTTAHIVPAVEMHGEETDGAVQQDSDVPQSPPLPEPAPPVYFTGTRLTDAQQQGMFNEAILRSVGGIMPVDPEQEPSTQTWGQVVIAITNNYELLQKAQREKEMPITPIPDFGPLRDRRVSPGKVYKALLALPITQPVPDEPEDDGFDEGRES